MDIGKAMTWCSVSLHYLCPWIYLSPHCSVNMTKTSVSVKGTSLCRDTLVSWVIHHLLPFFCIIKKRNFHLGLYVASIEIHSIRFDPSILICAECGLAQCKDSFCISILWNWAFLPLALDILYPELPARACWEQWMWLYHKTELWKSICRKIA